MIQKLNSILNDIKPVKYEAIYWYGYKIFDISMVLIVEGVKLVLFNDAQLGLQSPLFVITLIL